MLPCGSHFLSLGFDWCAEQSESVFRDGDQNRHENEHQRGSEQFSERQGDGSRDQVLRLLRGFGEEWCQPDDCRCGRQEYGAESTYPGTMQRRIHALAGFAFLIVAGYHHEAVVDDHTGQGKHGQHGHILRS